MYIDLPHDLEKQLKIAIAQRSPKLTIKTAVTEAIEAWIKKEKNKQKEELK